MVVDEIAKRIELSDIVVAGVGIYCARYLYTRLTPQISEVKKEKYKPILYVGGGFVAGLALKDWIFKNGESLYLKKENNEGDK